MDIFDIIFSPFLFIIKKLFLLSYSFSGNYGVSIIFLSFWISLILFPIFVLIERTKKKDDALKLKMKSLVEEIKRCYKGQERYYYLKTLNRQHNYSQLRALIPTLSLLLQIPFFIAAYQFLEAYAPMKGIGFLFIKDLNAPDGLLGSINVLPIAMTLVNLVTAYFYTRNGNTSERRQMLIVAAIFLVLLFKLPAGLVLYWTMNNVFSFFRLILTNPEIFKSRKIVRKDTKFSYVRLKETLQQLKPKLIVSFVVFIIVGLLTQLNWAFGNYFDGFELRILGVLAGSVMLTLLLALLVIFYPIQEEVKDLGIKELIANLWKRFRPLYFVLVSLVIITQINWALQYGFNDFLLRLSGTILGGAFVIGFFAGIALFYQNRLKLRLKQKHLNQILTSRVFKIAFILFTVFITASQINWAFRFYFNDIVIRIIVGIAISGIIAAVIAYILIVIKSSPQVNRNNFRIHIKREFAQFRFYFGVLIMLLIVFQLNWGFQNSFNGVVIRVLGAIIAGVFISVIIASLLAFLSMLNISVKELKLKPKLYYSLVFLGLYFYIAGKNYYLEENTSLSIIALIIILPTQLIATLFYYRTRKDFSAIIRHGINFLLVLVAGFELLEMFTLNADKQINTSILNINWVIGASSFSSIAHLGIIYSLIILPVYILQNQSAKPDNTKKLWWINILAIIYITGFIFLWNPLVIYSSYPSNFDFPAIDILKNNLLLFSVSSSAAFLFFILIPAKWKVFWTIGILTLVPLSFIHNTILPIDLGTLQEGKYVDQNNLAQPIFLYFLEGLVIMAIVYFAYLGLKKKYNRQIVVSLFLLNGILISHSLFESFNTGVFFEKPQKQTDSSASISFSKTEKNVVLVIADMFHGWYMDRILKEYPDFSQDLDGFVWYPNTVSVSSITASSIGPILGGYEYTIEKLNQDKERNLEEKITEITEEFYQKVKSKGYDFTSSHFIYSTIDESKFDSYLPKWHESWNHWNSELNIGLSKEIGYRLLWENALLFSSPLLLKSTIYNEGSWLHKNVETNDNTARTKPYNLVRVLPLISDTLNSEPVFINLHTYASHHPWDIIDEEGKLIADVSPYENNKWTLEQFVKWFNWMKENGVYDNTKIILLSDHGPHWRSKTGEVDKIVPLKNSSGSDVTEKETLMQYALLLVKDFNNRAELKIDNRLMSNADAPAIAFDENNPLGMDAQASRTLPSTIVRWEKKIWFKNELDILHHFEVTEDMYDLSNWKRVKAH